MFFIYIYIYIYIFFFLINSMIISFKHTIIAELRSLTLQVYAGSRRDNTRHCFSPSYVFIGSRRSAVSDSGTVSTHRATFQHKCYKSQQSLAATAESCLLFAESVWRFRPLQPICGTSEPCFKKIRTFSHPINT